MIAPEIKIKKGKSFISLFIQALSVLVPEHVRHFLNAPVPVSWLSKPTAQAAHWRGVGSLL